MIASRRLDRPKMYRDRDARRWDGLFDSPARVEAPVSVRPSPLSLTSGVVTTWRRARCSACPHFAGRSAEAPCRELTEGDYCEAAGRDRTPAEEYSFRLADMSTSPPCSDCAWGPAPCRPDGETESRLIARAERRGCGRSG